MKNDSISDPKKTDALYQLHSLKKAALLMQADPRQVVTANEAACKLFGKDLAQIEGKRGGQVFDCIHSFTPLGCGQDKNCEGCKIKNAVIETFTSGTPQESIRTVLIIKKDNDTRPYELQVSTGKVEGFVIITVDEYSKQLTH